MNYARKDILEPWKAISLSIDEVKLVRQCLPLLVVMLPKGFAESTRPRRNRTCGGIEENNYRRYLVDAVEGSGIVMNYGTTESVSDGGTEDVGTVGGREAPLRKFERVLSSGRS